VNVMLIVHLHLVAQMRTLCAKARGDARLLSLLAGMESQTYDC
jgi:hypothetical protein